MPNLKKISLLGCFCLVSMLYAYEPSVYGAGDMNSADPYGLTETEQAVLDNKKTIQSLFNRLNEQQRKIDGLVSIIDGQNREIVALKEQLDSRNQNNYQRQQDANQTYSLLLEMGQMIDNISNTYVSRDELKKVLAGSRPQSNTNRGSSLGTPIGSNSADTYRKGVQLFGTRSYNAARDHFEQTLSVNYKPAASNYYLAEVAYYTHNYADAVAYYKQSSSLYDSASYMPVLYLHTAISLAKTGETEQAKAFYQHVIDTYPNSRSASIAKKRL
jgi:TolA-binding protein